MSAQLAKKHILARQQMPTKCKSGEKWKKTWTKMANFSAAQEMDQS